MIAVADHEQPNRYPLDPILDRLHVDLRPEGLHALAIRLGISHRHARRLAAHGLDDRQADRYAIRLGLHPTALWPHWWDIEPDVEEGPDGVMS